MEPQPIPTTIEMDYRVKAVVEFMQQKFSADDLRGVAEAVSQLAPIMWGRFRHEPIVPVLTLSASPMG